MVVIPFLGVLSGQDIPQHSPAQNSPPQSEAPHDSPPQPSTTGRHIPALDGVRGCALLLVLADHLLWSNPHVAGNWLVRTLVPLHTAGWVGVDLFFVLSGFLITGILYDTLPDPHFFRNFYARRALRIFPLYYAFLLFVVAVSTAQGFHWNASLFSFLTYTENLMAGRPPTNAGWVNINHFWTLAIEEQFYFVWPLLVFVLRKRSRIASLALLGAAASFSVRLYLWHSGSALANPYQVFNWTPARLDGLLVGAALAMAIRSDLRSVLYRWWRPVALTLALALAAFYLRYPGLPILGYPVVEVCVPALLAAFYAALLVGAIGSGTVSRFFSLSGLRFFGRYSYGLYVFHPTIGSFTLGPLRVLGAHLGLPKGVSVLLAGAVTLLLSTAAALLSFHLFEKPMLRLKSRFQTTAQGPKLHAIAEHVPARAAA